MLFGQSMVVFLSSVVSRKRSRKTALSVLFHPGSHFSHGQDLDVPAVTGSSQPLQNGVEHGKPETGFGQIFRMKTEMKDPSVTSHRFESPAEALNAGSQGDDSGSRRPDRVEEQGRGNVPEPRERLSRPHQRRSRPAQFIETPQH